jgi:addiction module HigA family antidote
MDNTDNKIVPVHPGKTLQDFLKHKSISREKLSIEIGITPQKINQIINGKRNISPETAIVFADFFKTTPEFWTDLQTKFDLALAYLKFKDVIPDGKLEAIAHQPHDKLIKAVFLDRAEAESFFKAYLPKSIIKDLDWETLRLEGSRFIDEELKGTESDLLYRIKQINSVDEIFLYLLFENQSTPEKWMRLRLYKYKGRIWDDSFKTHKNQKKLKPILPIVFYHGKNKWNYSESFEDLVDDSILDMEYIPKFKHILLDHSKKNTDEIKGSTKAKIAQMLLLSHIHGQIHDLLDKLIEELSELETDSPGIDYYHMFIFYIAATHERELAVMIHSKVRNAYEQKQKEIRGGDLMLTAIESWKMEGKMAEKINIVENLLKVGIDWDAIKKAIGLDPQKFQQLKEKYQRLISQPVAAEL